MDIVWISLGACAVVGLLFVVLARVWRRQQLSQTWSNRQISQRLAALEEVDSQNNPRGAEERSASPLEQVFTFSFRLGDRFWGNTLGASPEELAYARMHGKLLGSVKIQRWRSHSEVTIHEVLPGRQATDLKARTVEIYPSETEEDRAITLWDLPLGPYPQGSTEHPPGLELRLVGNALEMCALYGRFSCEPMRHGSFPLSENLFFHVPLDAAQLGPFRVRGESDGDGLGPSPAVGEWMDFFQFRDESRGVEWQLCLRDLVRKDHSEKVKVWDVWEAKRPDT